MRTSRTGGNQGVVGQFRPMNAHQMNDGDPHAESHGRLGGSPDRSSDGSSTLVLLPTYNEIDNLEPLVRSLRVIAPALHLLIIDDASPDGTGALADGLRAERPDEIRVLHRPSKLGIGTAYVAGFRAALNGDYRRVVTMDVDLSHDPEALPTLTEACRDCGMALGSRYVPGGATVNWGVHRKLLSSSANVFVRVVLGIPVRDATSGYRCYSRQLLESLDLDEIHSEGYSFQIEMVWRSLRAGFDVEEVPICFADRVRGTSKISRDEIRKALASVLRMRRVMNGGERGSASALTAGALSGTDHLRSGASGDTLRQR